MRYNDRELVKIGESNADFEGVLQHMKPQGKDWSDWYQQPCFKERYFKLIANLLYYYRVNEQEPLGILVLENAQVAYERPHKGIPFAFSITFKVNDKFRDNDAKHVFSCRCEADVNKWVSVLKTASYEYWRSQYIILKTKIGMKTGQDPVLQYMKSKRETNKTASQIDVKKNKVKESQSIFYKHISTGYMETSFCERTTTVSSSNNVENLITL
ncbi:pleckstrin homology domain-containing family J member 1-like [Cylas formicarius]|uniref:pleckstrin homology domain-containing family J member 1-like n=1 Tax=Cylas formicarius TaxID=197179 RepID=UPI00295843B5|nr:pleckstrin homology domain-containing family J member 1-like [Cylas formicarius]